MPRLTVAMVVKDEAGRFLEPVLQAVRPWADCLVVLDDGSTDESPAIARRYADVFERNPEPLFGTEWRLRSKLWEMAAATRPDYIGVLDADEWFETIIADELDAAMQTGARVLTYRRYDLWGDLQHYRDDELWNAHTRMTPFAVRYDPALPQVWAKRNQHVGNFPTGWNMQVPVYGLLAKMAHLGWVRPEDQRAKHERHLRLDSTPDARGAVMYASILDPAPRLSRWEGAPVFSPSRPRRPVQLRRQTVTIASPVRQAPKVLAAFLRGLEELDPCGRRVRYAFADDCTDPEASRMLLEFGERHGAYVVRAEGGDGNPYARGDHHQWSAGAMGRLGEIRTHLMGVAIKQGADHLLMVDSDVVLRPDTLHWLLEAGQPIVCEVMWTQYYGYQKHRHPNCWAWGESNFYPGLSGEQIEPLEMFDRWAAWYRMLRRPGVYPVGGLGAVTLIRADALQATHFYGGYRPIPNSGSYGEDRWFCTRAAVLGFPLWADTHAEPLHLYRDSDLRRLAAWRRRHGAKAVMSDAAV